jgi:hypothetical protein
LQQYNPLLPGAQKKNGEKEAFSLIHYYVMSLLITLHGYIFYFMVKPKTLILGFHFAKGSRLWISLMIQECWDANLPNSQWSKTANSLKVKFLRLRLGV